MTQRDTKEKVSVDDHEAQTQNPLTGTQSYNKDSQEESRETRNRRSAAHTQTHKMTTNTHRNISRDIEKVC